MPTCLHLHFWHSLDFVFPSFCISLLYFAIECVVRICEVRGNVFVVSFVFCICMYCFHFFVFCISLLYFAIECRSRTLCSEGPTFLDLYLNFYSLCFVFPPCILQWSVVVGHCVVRGQLFVLVFFVFLYFPSVFCN